MAARFALLTLGLLLAGCFGSPEAAPLAETRVDSAAGETVQMTNSRFHSSYRQPVALSNGIAYVAPIGQGIGEDTAAAIAYWEEGLTNWAFSDEVDGEYAAASGIGDEVYLFREGEDYRIVADHYNIATRTIERGRPVVPAPAISSWTYTLPFEGRILIFGGCCIDNNHIWEYEPESRSFRIYATMPPHASNVLWAGLNWDRVFEAEGRIVASTHDGASLYKLDGNKQWTYFAPDPGRGWIFESQGTVWVTDGGCVQRLESGTYKSAWPSGLTPSGPHIAWHGRDFMLNNDGIVEWTPPDPSEWPPAEGARPCR